ncbi:hypothetical protein T01_5016 [Trichinella spiralis]|uniref:Uncharacterized protein n=1 Tax=Trichinella spiralis TaxID=6334 RepID=A0A0V1BX79_TRISP|nr:hypothetical protein T01_5016 [Trichinella spiralis]
MVKRDSDIFSMNFKSVDTLKLNVRKTVLTAIWRFLMKFDVTTDTLKPSNSSYCHRAVIDKQKISEFCSTFLWSSYFALLFDLIVPNSE